MQLGLKSVGTVHRVTEEKVMRKHDLYKSLNVAKRRAVRLSECWVLQQRSHRGDPGFPSAGWDPASCSKSNK